MTKYKFSELPDWAREGLYTRSDNLSDYYRIKSGNDVPANDIVYLFIRGTWFNKFDVDLMERSNYACLIRDYPGQFVECGGYYSLYLMYPITTTRKGKLRIPDEIIEALDTIVEYGIFDDNDYCQRESEEIERQFAEYAKSIANGNGIDISDDIALNILDVYQDTFEEYAYLECDSIVMGNGVDEFILSQLEERK